MPKNVRLPGDYRHLKFTTLKVKDFTTTFHVHMKWLASFAMQVFHFLLELSLGKSATFEC
jgi:hypothetical protein